MKRFNQKYLNLIYKIGTKLKNPMWSILSIWVPLSIIMIIVGYKLIDMSMIINILIVLSIPILYATFLITSDIKVKKRKYAELEKIGIEVFGDKNKFKVWMNSSIASMGNRKPIESNIDDIKEELNKINEDIFN